MIRATVLYPASATRFDHDYYVNKHAPRVLELWKPLGLLKAEINKGIGGIAPGSAPNYVTITVLTFESVDAVQACLAAHGAEVMADIVNFTDAQPDIQLNEVLM